MDKTRQAGFTRRSFLIGTGLVGAGLTVGVYLNRRNNGTRLAHAEEMSETVSLEWDPRAFVHVGNDNRVTVYSKHTEMGQGIYTGLATIVAEELGADWGQMRVEPAPANLELYVNLSWGEQATGGSSSLAYSFDQLRHVSAAIRDMLARAAAQKWDVPLAEVSISGGLAIHEVSGRELKFGDLAEAAASLPVPESVVLKPVTDYRLSRYDIQRVDVADKTNGNAMFTQDIKLPGMKTAIVAHAPRFGAVVASFDDTRARSVAGVVDVVEIPSGVAVIANDFWSAQKARDLLAVEWDESKAIRMSSQDIVDQFKAMADTEGAIARDEGSVGDALSNASQTISAEFEFPMLAHSPIEPLNCVVQWSGDRCRIWSGTQQQSTDQADAAEILGIPLENVEINTLLAGGGFGRRACIDYAQEAVQIAKAMGPGTPVKLMWTREDDMRAGMYRPLNYHRMQAGIDEAGKITAWQHIVVGQSIASQAMPEWIVDGVDNMSVHGANDWLYDVPNVRVVSHSPELPIPVLWYRGVGATHTVFSVETFIDEIAAQTRRDPLEYRLEMLKDHPRMAEVTRLAAEMADWNSPIGPNRGRGIAICKQRGTYLAQVAEVTVMNDGSFSVDRVVTTLDCGQVINPDIVRAQMEGGTGFGLSSAVGDAITMRDGYIEQSNFDRYPLLRINQMPDVEVHLVESWEPPSGVGELAPMAVSAAVANALHTVTGNRYRSLPIKSA